MVVLRRGSLDIKKIRTLGLVLPLLIAAAPVAKGAEDPADAEELNIIEVELEKGKSSSTPLPEEAPESPASPAETKAMDFSGLGRLAPFTEVSVLQRRFLPKTGRFQVFVGGTMITNDPFFNTFGGVLKASYFFTEGVGLEFDYYALSTSEAKATQELKDIQGLTTNSLVFTKNMMGANLLFVPVYGKMTWFNEHIVPFDLYFSIGAGTTTTQAESAGTLRLGAGQIFAISKSSAFRWDFNWGFFNATGITQEKSGYNNLFLTLGWGWFFPEANYR